MGFWDARYWLPRDVSWEDLRSNATFRYPDSDDLTYSVKYGVLMLLVRVLFECLVFLPLGHYFGWIASGDRRLGDRILAHLNFGFAGKSKFKRVAESAWKFLFYLCAFISGYYVLRDQPQLYDVSECWRHWPHHSIPNKVWWYYIIESSFYCSLLFSSLVFDVRRADFLQMLLHHTVTLTLLFMSFTLNMVRVGTLILFSHDVADIFIELGKLFRYAQWQTALMVLFAIFMVVWVLTRLIYYPFWIIKSVIFDAPPLVQADYRWENLSQQPVVPRILVAMLLCLLVLHFFWTYVIVNVAIQSTTTGGIDDIRERESDDSDAEARPPPKRSGAPPTTTTAAPPTSNNVNSKKNL